MFVFDKNFRIQVVSQMNSNLRHVQKKVPNFKEKKIIVVST